MRKRLPSALGIAVILALCLPFMLSCATNATPKRAAYTTISDVDAGVKAAMGAFNDRYQAGLQTEGQRTQVLAAYVIYQKAAHVAVSVGQDLGQPANGLQIANDAAGPLLNLIASFLPSKGATP